MNSIYPIVNNETLFADIANEKCHLLFSISLDWSPNTVQCDQDPHKSLGLTWPASVLGPVSSSPLHKSSVVLLGL